MCRPLGGWLGVGRVRRSYLSSCGSCFFFSLRVPPCVSFFSSVASSITYLFALCFRYREGVQGGFFFALPYLPYLVQLLVVIQYRLSVCVLCGWGGGWGFIPCFSLTLSPSSCTLRAFGVSWFLGCGSCLFACVCMRGPFGALLRNFNIFGFHTYADVVEVVRGERALNILVRHTIVFPWFVAFSYSESVCMLCGWGGGWGFIPCFSLTFSPSSCTSRAFGVSWFHGRCSCLYACGACVVPLVPSVAILTYLVSTGPHLCLRCGFLTYLFAIPLFPHAPWPSHTLCLFFSVVMYLAVPAVYGGMGIWVWFVFKRILYDVPGGSLFVFACGVVPLVPSFTTYLVSSPTHA